MHFMNLISRFTMKEGTAASKSEKGLMINDQIFVQFTLLTNFNKPRFVFTASLEENKNDKRVSAIREKISRLSCR